MARNGEGTPPCGGSVEGLPVLLYDAGMGWRRGSWLLLVGDLLVFHLQTWIGYRSHGIPWAPSRFLLSALPFWSAWVVVAWGAGWARDRKVSLLQVIQSWVIAWPLALLFRILLLHRPVPLSFALVVLGTNMILLSLWRGLARRLPL